jgi:hypothetical protein
VVESNNEHASWPDLSVQLSRSEWLTTTPTDKIVHFDVSWLVPADLDAVDALARLQVAASRCGHSLLLHGADGGLTELIEFVGLGGIVHACSCCRRVCNGV